MPGAELPHTEAELLALQRRWATTLSARLDQAIERAGFGSDFELIAAAWQGLARELSEVRRALDAHEASAPTLADAQRQEFRMLALAAGLAGLDTPADEAVQAGQRLRTWIRAQPVPPPASRQVREVARTRGCRLGTKLRVAAATLACLLGGAVATSTAADPPSASAAAASAQAASHSVRPVAATPTVPARNDGGGGQACDPNTEPCSDQAATPSPATTGMGSIAAPQNNEWPPCGEPGGRCLGGVYPDQGACQQALDDYADNNRTILKGCFSGAPDEWGFFYQS